MPKHIDVVGAVIVRDGLIFCAQRGQGSALAGKWEFPGGKLEAGESAAIALEREIREELDCVVQVGAEVTITSYEYDFAVVNLRTFYCELIEGEPILSEHKSLLWVAPDKLDDLDWAPADIPAVKAVQSALAGR